MIRISPIRLINEENEMLGVVETPEALRMAREAGLDLVEVAADSDPPVCRILDYGKFKYEQAKKDKATKAKSKTSELKEVRLGRSMKIDPHDIQIRLNQARRFLMDGHKVQIVQNFRGREMVHKHRGTQRMQDIIEQLSDIAKLEMPPRQNGRRMTMLLSPDKTKVEQVKRRAAAEAEKAKTAGSSEGKSSEGKSSKAKSETPAPPPPAAPPAPQDDSGPDGPEHSEPQTQPAEAPNA
ncbi:MAG: translation initiation factor IF-3 [Phycisphaerales bacterium]|nr:translation initiation factor IF-3 [Phycisphaerales bacterium]NNM26962.1 translation initiation factor IF-3 [Phycisphaerales bacterium]